VTPEHQTAPSACLPEIVDFTAWAAHPTIAPQPEIIAVLTEFARLLRHPRASTEEARVRQEIIALAARQGWPTRQDAVGNLAVDVPPTPGHELRQPVILQGHLDIVTTAADRSLPRRAEIVDRDEDGAPDLWLQTEGQTMTLGADNGIGVALSLALMLDPTVTHGPVTLLFTVDEETGMTGAQDLDPTLPPPDALLVNLDSEEGADCITIGCAGSSDLEAHWGIPERRDPPHHHVALCLSLSGWPGGHSGTEIDKGNGNPIFTLAKVLYQITYLCPDLELVSIDGGSARNAIPTFAKAVFTVPDDSVPAVQWLVKAYETSLRCDQDRNEKGHAGLSLKRAERVSMTCAELSEPVKVMTPGVAISVLSDTLRQLPVGPLDKATLPQAGEIVTLSSNLSLVTTTADGIKVVYMTRAAKITNLRRLTEGMHEHLGKCGAVASYSPPTDGWLEDASASPAVQQALAAVRASGHNPRLIAYHAGLECGIITAKGRGLTAVSLGPLITGAHTPQERVSLASIAQVWRVLRTLLANV
jgi:dipeptidase D